MSQFESAFIVNGTPIEQYVVNGRTIWVKREDLSTKLPLPPLAKLRGASVLLQNLKNRNINLVANQDTPVSKSGLGIAVICRELGINCILGYPHGQSGIPPSLKLAQTFGAELYPEQPNYIRINYQQLKRFAEAKGGYIIPFGVACVESVRAVAEEAATVPEELLSGTLIICVGTGTIVSGVALGLKRLPKIIGVSSGMSAERQMKTIGGLLLEANMTAEHFIEFLEKFTLIPPIMPYSERCLIETPFPAHENYDKKSYKWMRDHIDELAQPILFWDIGA